LKSYAGLAIVNQRPSELRPLRITTDLPATFSPVFVPDQKRYQILPFERPGFRPFRNITQPSSLSILSGQTGFIILQTAGELRLPQRANRGTWITDFTLTSTF